MKAFFLGIVLLVICLAIGISAHAAGLDSIARIAAGSAIGFLLTTGLSLLVGNSLFWQLGAMLLSLQVSGDSIEQNGDWYALGALAGTLLAHYYLRLYEKTPNDSTN